MNTNRITLEQFIYMTMAQRAGLPIEVLADLQAEVNKLKSWTKNAVEVFNDTIADRFADAADAARLAKGKNTGDVTLTEGDYKVKANLPKKVEWDQERLREAVETLRQWGENPDEYVTTEIKVSETQYNAWPSAVKSVFEPARTVNAGKETFKLEYAGAPWRTPGYSEPGSRDMEIE